MRKGSQYRGSLKIPLISQMSTIRNLDVWVSQSMKFEPYFFFTMGALMHKIGMGSTKTTTLLHSKVVFFFVVELLGFLRRCPVQDYIYSSV